MVSSSASRVWTISGRPVARAPGCGCGSSLCCRSRGRVVVEIVEAALADGDDLGMRRQLEQRGRVVEALLAGLVRVDADRAQDLGPAFGQRDADRPADALGGDVDHRGRRRRPGRARSRRPRPRRGPGSRGGNGCRRSCRLGLDVAREDARPAPAATVPRHGSGRAPRPANARSASAARPAGPAAWPTPPA